MSYHSFHKTGCRAGGPLTIPLTFSEKINRLSKGRSKMNMNSCCGCDCTMRLQISWMK